MYSEVEAEQSPCELRPPCVADGAAIWQLVRESGVLDANSCYAYLLLCRDFAETCRVARIGERLAGFATGYLPPARPQTLFVWQIGVAPFARRRGLAGALLRHLLGGPACRDVRYIEATVAPDNEPSRRMFAALAEALNADLREQPGFAADDFAADDSAAVHAEERTIRIGPFTTPSLT